MLDRLEKNYIVSSSIQRPALLNRVPFGKFNRASIQHLESLAPDWVTKTLAQNWHARTGLYSSRLLYIEVAGTCYNHVALSEAEALPSLRGVGSTSRKPACKPYGLASGS